MLFFPLVLNIIVKLEIGAELSQLLDNFYLVLTNFW